MSRVVLQVPVDQELRREAEKAAEKEGFGSLQDAVRLFLKKLAEREIAVKLEEVVHLSPKNERRYMKMSEDFRGGRNVFTAKDVDDLMRQLHEA